MPLVDVSDILLDPDIAGQDFTVIRRQETVNSFGESVWSAQHIPNVVGSVQPGGDNALQREEGQDAQANSITVVTPFRLRGVAKGPGSNRYKPDIILWSGSHFEVMSLNSWGDFGGGFVEAECSSITYVDPPPEAPLLEWGQLDFSRPVNAGYALGAGG